jgi:low temperature requirement protein LtrA
MPRSGQSLREEWRSPLRRYAIVLRIASFLTPLIAFFVFHSFFAEGIPFVALWVVALLLEHVADVRDSARSAEGAR